MVAVLIVAAGADASTIVFTGSSGTLSASAQFKLTPTGVTVTLTNTAGPTPEKLVPADVLTAVYFNLTGASTLTPLEAVALNGLIPATSPPPGAYWAYQTNLQNAALHGAHSGISSTGLNVFGPNGNFSCGAGCQPLDGLNYGIVPNVYTAGQKLEAVPLMRYSAQFTLQGNAQHATVSNVWFQYGTDLSEPSFQGFEGGGGEVPEPSAAVLTGCGLLLAALGARVRKRLRRDP